MDRKLLFAANATELREVSVPLGRRMEWMAQRTAGKPDLLRNVQWGGRAAFAAYEFFIDDGARGYTFVLPKDCGNLALVSTGASPRAEAAEARRAEEARAEAARAAEAARKAEEARRAEEARKAEEAKQAAEAAERDRRAKVDWFLGALGGKERRVREMTPGIINGRCAPLFGLKAGPDVRLGGSGWRLAPAIGVAINTRDTDHTSLFGEAELNYWIKDKGFIGAGAGVWDFNHSDTVAGILLLQGGRELARTANDVRFLLVAEGRLFFDKLDDIDNNYQAWAGLRVVFR